MINLKQAAQRLFPKLYVALYRARQRRKEAITLVNEARALRRTAQNAPPEVWVRLVLSTPAFCASQQPAEIQALIERLIALQPQRLCEIGCYRGGTLFLFCCAAAPNAHLISLDLAHTPERMRAYQFFRQPKQRLSFICSNSHALPTQRHLRRLLNGAPLDFLFIDGDHSYAGVKADFEAYAPLVRKGGLIAFHDIVPNHSIRGGCQAVAYSGEVHRFWREVKLRYAYEEYIQAPDQDGYGIGILVKS